ncbi:hypothetical protein I4F81_009947 [Pyropia yezoensis]|uniref:Uncharacterized protein n=1 Tax=Pyropia yezoensis TaxID=2788 RepID=A0ACC3CBV6_PYRYE|nr:hypothetical protein I4F81_009947 [Neopyropia yezoensis]
MGPGARAFPGAGGSQSCFGIHVAQSVIVDKFGLGGAGAQPRARASEAAVAVALDEGATSGAARLTGAIAADVGAQAGQSAVAPPVDLPLVPAGTVERARQAALAMLDGIFQSQQNPK